MLKEESGLQLLVSLLVDKQQTTIDEDKEKKAKKEKGVKEGGGVAAKPHILEGPQIPYVIYEIRK